MADVADESPAYEAGIRNDDVLLKIGELDATKWRTDPKVLPLSRFWNSPAGTKLELTLKRGDRELADSYHVATLDNDAEAIFEGSLKFVQDHAG